MGQCTSTQTTQQHPDTYYIDITSHRVLFFENGRWFKGAIRENRKKHYLIVYDHDDDWKIKMLKKKRSQFISPDVWEMYANNQIDNHHLVIYSF